MTNNNTFRIDRTGDYIHVAFDTTVEIRTGTKVLALNLWFEARNLRALLDAVARCLADGREVVGVANGSDKLEVSDTGPDRTQFIEIWNHATDGREPRGGWLAMRREQVPHLVEALEAFSE